MTENAVTKVAVVSALSEVLTDRLVAVERVAAMARDEVASDETRQEGKYDTRATEASYLARGQAWRVAELRRLVAWCSVFDPHQPRHQAVGVGSLVHIAGPRSGWVFVAPIGGPKVEVEGETIRVISLDAPLGQAMLELEADEAFEVDTPQGLTEYEVVEIL